MCRQSSLPAQLVPILTDYQLESVALHALYPGGRRPSVKVRTFSDLPEAGVDRDDWAQMWTLNHVVQPYVGRSRNDESEKTL